MKMEHVQQMAAGSFYEALLRKRPEYEKKYIELTPTSQLMFKAAAEVMPGGSTRDSVLRAPYPTFMQRGEGAFLYDVDDRILTDFWFNASSLPLGHCHPAVVEAASKRVGLGSAFFAPGVDATTHAHEILKRLPSGDKIRFTNSGSEAVMLAIRIARGATGRDIIAKFEGSYHGTYDDVSWSVTPGANLVGDAKQPNSVAESGGLPSNFGRSIVVPYNDLAATEVLLEQHAGRVAAILVEPLANRMGLILPEPDFIHGLRALCDKHGIVLVFDEVIAFRVGYNGAQGAVGIKPDLTTLGKVVGGGFPVGAVLGRDEIMSVSTPNRKDGVKHAGTFNANPVTMVAGLATLKELTTDVFHKLNERADTVRSMLRKSVEGLPIKIDGHGSLFKISATETKITDYRTSLLANAAWEEAASMAMATEGFLMTTRLHGCVSTVTTMDEIEAFIGAFSKIIRI